VFVTKTSIVLMFSEHAFFQSAAQLLNNVYKTYSGRVLSAVARRNFEGLFLQEETTLQELFKAELSNYKSVQLSQLLGKETNLAQLPHRLGFLPFFDCIFSLLSFRQVATLVKALLLERSVIFIGEQHLIGQFVLGFN